MFTKRCQSNSCGFLVMALALGSAAQPAAADPTPPADLPLPVSGEGGPGVAAFDTLITEFMRKWRIPAGAVAVSHQGRLVFARGYGIADPESGEPVTPDALFRIASVSKPITAVAVLRLVEQKKLSLDDRAFDRLRKFPLPEGADVDRRLKDITVAQLLHHTAGWDRDQSFDPMFRPKIIAEATDTPPPASSEAIIRYMQRQPLDFTPGERYAYSNFGYCVLGRIIEAATEQPYEDAVRELVLKPARINDMRLGRTRIADRPASEVRYHDDVEGLTESVFPDVKEKVAVPDGGFYLEALDAHGGWIASAADLVRFASAVEGRGRHALLQPDTIRIMTGRPAPPIKTEEPNWYGLGWMVRSVKAEGENWWHTGSLPGTMAILVRTHDGRAWAALFNSRPAPMQSDSAPAELDRLLWKAAAELPR
jgi:N-acyl-D-amino-acid deacylase